MATRGLIIVEMKTDNELSINISVRGYFKSVKTVRKMFPVAGVEPRTFNV